jgi:5-hydroxyisourate hydrolase-like protein (transthyretin family)
MDGVRLTIATGTEVDGVVTGLPSGQLGGLNVTVSATGFQSAVVTSDDGRFTLTSVPPGVVRISAATTMPSVRTVAKTVEISDDDAQTSVELAFEGGSRLSGAVTRSGQPLSQFSITAAPDPPDGTGRRYTAMSDGSGHYAIEDLTDGNYQVSVLSGSSPYRLTIAVSGETNGDIAMPAASLTGFVIDSASGQPLEGASIVAQTGAEATSQSIQRTTTDSTGAYTLSGFDPGNYQVSARKDGYQLKTQSATVGADPATLDFALDAGSGLTIQASDGLSGMPLGGIMALAFGAGGAVAYQGTVSLDSAGNGQIPSLPPGRYAVYLFSSGYAPQALASVYVPSAPVRVTLTPGGRVEARASSVQYGRIVDGSGSSVLLSPFRLDGSVTVAPPVSVWEHLPPGSFVFLAPGGNGGAEVSYPFTVAEGQTTRLALP